MIDNSSVGADGIKLGDINGDGLPDIVTGWEEAGEIRVYVNPGTLKTTTPWPRVSVGRVASPEDAIFVDLDHDGRLEVVSCTEGKDRSVYLHRLQKDGDLLNPLHWHTAVFPATKNLQRWMQALPLDLDAQYGTDLLLMGKEKNGSLGILSSPSDPHDLGGWIYRPLREVGWGMSLLPCDLDDDGDQDVIFTDRKNGRMGAFWLENPGAVANRQSAAWVEHPIGALGEEVYFADVGDFDMNGLMDVACAVKPHMAVVCLRQADRSWKEVRLAVEGSNLGEAKAVKFADLNRDGVNDLVFSTQGATEAKEGLVWLEHVSDGSWRQHALSGPDGVKFDQIEVLDLDGDGDLDVITCEEKDLLGVIWYENPLNAVQPSQPSTP